MLRVTSSLSQNCMSFRFHELFIVNGDCRTNLQGEMHLKINC